MIQISKIIGIVNKHLNEILEKKSLDDDLKNGLDEFIVNYKKEYVW